MELFNEKGGKDRFVLSRGRKKDGRTNEAGERPVKKEKKVPVHHGALPRTKMASRRFSPSKRKKGRTDIDLAHARKRRRRESANEERTFLVGKKRACAIRSPGKKEGRVRCFRVGYRARGRRATSGKKSNRGDAIDAHGRDSLRGRNRKIRPDTNYTRRSIAGGDENLRDRLHLGEDTG